jgi:pilus assembly protein Flp/PilA
MDTALRAFDNFAANEDGATAIEYGLIATLVAVGAILSFGAVGAGLVNVFGTTESGAGGAIQDAANSI